MRKEINYLVMAILLIGMALLLGGGYGLYSIRQAEKEYESTVGIVKRMDYKRVHRHRKVLTKCEILLRYDTRRYGELSVLKEPILPLWGKEMKSGSFIIRNGPGSSGFRFVRNGCGVFCLWAGAFV